MPRRARLRVGDIVAIPVDGDRTSFGQIFDISFPGKFYFGVFDVTFPGDASPQPGVIASHNLLLVGETLDALLFHGRWSVIGNTPIQANVPYPWYRVAVGATAEPHISTYSRSVVRPAKPHELALVDHRATFAPIIFDQAVKASFGVGDWRPEYDQLKVDHVRQQLDLVGDS